jgi:hypothetical protein
VGVVLNVLAVILMLREDWAIAVGLQTGAAACYVVALVKFTTE